MSNNQKAIELLDEKFNSLYHDNPENQRQECFNLGLCHMYNAVEEILKSLLSQEGEREVEQTIEHLNGTTHCLECGSTDDQTGEDYCEHCGQKLIWPEQSNKGGE